MAQEITRLQDRGGPAIERERMLSLPVSVRSLLGALGEVTIDGRTTKYLPAGMSLTSRDRSELERRVGEITRVLDGSGQTAARLAHLAKFVAGFRNSRGSELDREAQGEAFEDALDDIPAWVVAETIRRWNRAEIGSIEGQKIDLNFQPTPPIFRLACLKAMRPHRDDLARLRELLEAKPLAEVMDHKPSPKVVQGFDALSKSLGSVADTGRQPNPAVAAVAAAARARQAEPQPEASADV
jgi:hypothetical protein